MARADSYTTGLASTPGTPLAGACVSVSWLLAGSMLPGLLTGIGEIPLPGALPGVLPGLGFYLDLYLACYLAI